MRAAIAAGIFWTGVMLARLFAGGPVGLADQGDGARLLCTLGAANDRPWNADILRYVYPTWVPHTWFGETCGAGTQAEGYRSTELMLLWPAKLLTGLLGLPGVVDTRALGVLCALLVGVICAGFVLVVPAPTAVRLAVASAFGLIYADSAFAGFFVSPYAEPAALLGAGATLIAMLALWRRRRATAPLLAFVLVAGVFTIGAKSQLASYALPIAIALVWLPHRGSNRWLPTLHPVFRPVIRRGPGLAMALVLVATTAITLAERPERQVEAAAYDAVFGTVLHDNPDAAASLTDLGVDPALAGKADTNLGDADSAALAPEYDTFRERVTPGALAWFYLTHPGRMLRTIGWGLSSVAQLEIDYLGSYPADSGMPPGAKEHRIRVVGTLWGIFRLLPILLIVLWLWVFRAGFVLVRRRGAPAVTAIGRLAMIVPLMIVTQFAAVLMTEGRVDATRHLVDAGFLTACCLPLLALTLWFRARSRTRLAPWQTAPGMPAPELEPQGMGGVTL